jgi:hypothetical protein
MIRKASITSKGMSYIKRIDMVSDGAKRIETNKLGLIKYIILDRSRSNVASD